MCFCGEVTESYHESDGKHAIYGMKDKKPHVNRVNKNSVVL